MPRKLAVNRNPGEAQRRVRRRLARLYEALRLAKNGGSLDPALIRKLWPSWKRSVSTEEVKAEAAEELRALKQQQAEQERLDTRRRLKNWKNRMCQGTFGDLGRWIRNQKQACFGVTLYSPKGDAHDRIQAAEMIHDFWTSIWKESNIDVQEAAANLRRQFGQDRRQLQWTPLSLEALEQSVRKAKGSGGADGWDGDELRFTPPAAVKCFHDLVLQWAEMGTLPPQLLQARQVTMPKPDKIEEGSRLHVSGTRPLTVMSVWWRAYASAWVHCKQMSEWTSANLDSRVCYGKGSESPEASVDRLQTQYAKHGGVLGTLDFSQAFDRIHPKLTSAALAELNFPPGLARLLELAWGEQQRFIQWDGHTCPRTLRPAGTPQGCPLAPLILAVYTSAGLRETESQQTLSADVSVYMDDRRMYARWWWAVKSRINSWASWSLSMGLLENQKKTQICGRKKQAKQELSLDCPPAWIRSDIKALGCTSTSQPRKESSNECARIASAVECAALLRSVPLAWHRKTLAFQCFVLSKASFGWVSRFPTQTSAGKVFNSMTAAYKTNHMAIKDLRKILYGAVLDLSLVVACRTWRRLAKDFDRGRRLQWSAGPHTAVGSLRKEVFGFLEAGPWTRLLPETEKRVKLEGSAALDAQLHALRAQYRRQAFERFLRGKRHEARELTARHSAAALRKAYAEISIKHTREALGYGPGHRAALLASVVSPSWYAKAHADEEDVSQSCPWCNHELGSWIHLVWGCPANAPPDDLRPPQNPLALRFGWQETQNPDSALVLAHMARTAEKLWKSRYETSPG